MKERKRFYELEGDHLKIIFKNVSDLKLKVVACILIFAFGLYLIIALLFAKSSPLEYQTVYGNYHSYRTKTGVAGISTYRTNKYITVKISDKGEVEYRIHSVSLPAFEEKSFLQDVAVGDPIELILQEGEIVSIRTNGKSYMNKADSFEKQQNNTVLGYYVGGGFIVVSLLAFSTLIHVRKVKHSKKYKR